MKFLNIIIGLALFSPISAKASSSLQQLTILGGTKPANGAFLQLGRMVFRVVDARSEHAVVSITQSVSMFSTATSTSGAKWTQYKFRASLRGVVAGAPGTGYLYDRDEREVYLNVTAGINQSSQLITLILAGNDLLPGEYEVIMENWVPDSTRINPVRYGETRVKAVTTSKF